MMQRQDHASGANANAPGQYRQRRRKNRWIGIESAKSMEMTFRHPDRGEIMLIGKPGAFEKKPVFVTLELGFIAGKIKQAELHEPMTGRKRGIGMMRARNS